MDSGIIQRVRQLKSSLGESIYHPGVLATLAPYNAAFGDRFDTLFDAAAKEIKDYSRRLEELGGSILSTVDGVEVTVEHVAALNQEALMQGGLQRGPGKIPPRRPAEKRIGAPPADPPRQPQTPRTWLTQLALVARPLLPRWLRPQLRRMFPLPSRPQALSVEEAKLRRVEESIRVFVRVADPKFRQIVPMRYFNLMLSPAEIEAYTADYLEQSGPTRRRRPHAAAHRRGHRAHHHRDGGT